MLWNDIKVFIWFKSLKIKIENRWIGDAESDCFQCKMVAVMHPRLGQRNKKATDVPMCQFSRFWDMVSMIIYVESECFDPYMDMKDCWIIVVDVETQTCISVAPYRPYAQICASNNLQAFWFSGELPIFMLATLGCLVKTTLFNKIKQNQPISKEATCQ